MDIEMVSNVNANYATGEAVKKHAPKASERVESESVNNATLTNDVASTSQVSAMEEKRNADQQGGDQNKKEHTPSEATMDDAVKRANMKMEKTRCEYSYHKETNRVSIKVIDSDTDKVIREIPPEKSLDMLQKMWEMAGIMVDEKR